METKLTITDRTNNIAITNYKSDYANEPTFDFIFIHELSHAVDGLDPDYLTHKSQLDSAVNKDFRLYPNYPNHGFVTYYSYTVCFNNQTLDTQLGEDYAEMIAYYLNPSTSVVNICGGPFMYNPYDHRLVYAQQHPNHKALAKSIVGSF